MTRALWLNPAVGVAGDMVLAALLDAGADEKFVRAQLDRLRVDGWDLVADRGTRAGIVATRVEVSVAGDHPHRPWSSIDALLAGATLHAAVATGARSTFRRLAEAEAHVHGIDVNDVAFHEVGAIDAIVDIVGSWAALVSLDVGTVVSGPVGLGSGTASTAHGRIPVPAPATLELLTGLPVTGIDAPFETATPTGAALLATMADRWGPMPAGRVEATGRGAGTADPPTHANLVTAVLIAVEQVSAVNRVTSTLVETNVDDVTPEILGYVIERAIALGADDAWVVPITMKKSRPAHQVRILCAPALDDVMIHLLTSETGTLGVRRSTVDKVVLDRRTDTVDLDGHPVRIKVGPHGAKPEHDDLVRAAESLGRPLREVELAARALWAGADRPDS